MSKRLSHKRIDEMEQLIKTHPHDTRLKLCRFLRSNYEYVSNQCWIKIKEGSISDEDLISEVRKVAYLRIHSNPEIKRWGGNGDVLQSRVPGKYVDVKEAVAKEREEKKIVRSLGRLPSVIIDEEAPKELAGYKCVNCGDHPALKNNSGLCQFCCKKLSNPVYRTTSSGLHIHG